MAFVLNDDLWVAILCFCDVSTVFTVSLTSRWLRCLTQSRTIWLSIFKDLSSRGLIAATPLPNPPLSTKEIVEHIKSTVCGIPSFSPRPRVVHLPRPLRLMTLFSTCGPVSLLPSGRYLAVVHPRSFECIEAATGKRVWRWRGGGSVQDFRALLLGDGTGARFAFVVKDPADGARGWHIQVVEASFRHGAVRHPQARKRFDMPFLSGSFANLTLAGNFISIAFRLPGLRGGGLFSLLVNWRKRAYLLFDCSQPHEIAERPTILLPKLLSISGHLLLSTTGVDGTPVLLRWNMSSLSSFWRSTEDFSLQSAIRCGPDSSGPPPDDIHDLFRGTIWDAGSQELHLHMQLFRNPIRHSRARLFIHLSGDINLPSPPSSPIDAPRRSGMFASIPPFRWRRRSPSPSSSSGSSGAQTGILLRYELSCWPAPFEMVAAEATPTKDISRVQDLSYAGWATRATDGALVPAAAGLASASKTGSLKPGDAGSSCLWRHLTASGALATVIDESTVVVS
ncbi:hypothetical protein HMN09_00161300 [Mycena chlorophos]|uniref:F-box domain-containing protein n=1 Tax=Mycena chlorophos TaxID=658473 RepID=A0A8H6TN03_MYCCL|nr:hypothetical protein HMN09_00161300 [Mycena chlorophos]